MTVTLVPYPEPVPDATCPKCGRLVYLDDDGNRHCGRWWYGPGFSCGWKSRQPAT